MQKTKNIALILAILMAVSMPITIFGMSSVKAAGPTVGLSSTAFSGPPYVVINSTFTVNVTIANAVNVWAYEINMTWDHSALQMLSIVDGGWFADNVPLGSNTNFIAGDINNTAGTLVLAGNVILGSAPETGVGGNGNLAVCTFKALKSGNTNITATTLLLSPIDPPVPFNAHPTIAHTDPVATAKITGIGDINFDGIVDIYDAIILAGHFNTNTHSSNWLPASDLNGDGVVDIYDAIILAGHFGQKYL